MAQLLAQLAHAEQSLAQRNKPKQAKACSDARHALAAIHALVDGQEWDADTADDIACVLLQYGFEINEPAY